MTKELIGVRIINTDALVGPIVGSVIVTEPNFFRKFGFLDLNKPQTKGWVELNKVVDLTSKYVLTMKTKKVDAAVINETSHEEQIYKLLLELINSVYRFWGEKVHIVTDFTELDREQMFKVMKKYMPENLEKQDIHYEEWVLENKPNHRITKLADCYAVYGLNEVNKDIKTTWGDFGTGLGDDTKTQDFIEANPDCPNIRILED